MINPNKTKKKRDDLINYFKKKNIVTSIHYIPIHGHPYFKKYKFKLNQFDNANFYNENAISLPIFPDLSNKKQEYIVQSIRKFFNKK